MSITSVPLLTLLACLAGATPPGGAAPSEVRGTWVTTTANTHIASPERTAETMRRLAEIGLNTVYVETWKNGYTQYPSAALERVIGVDRRPDLVKQDPGDPDGALPARDLLGETLIEAHRNGLLFIAWFEYGFMAAHKDTDNHLRRMRPEWLSRDIDGNTVAPNGFVWMNPLHPEARRFLLDLVLEAVDKYDLDGIQLDDRIVWPYYTMGYDDFTVAWYRNEHGGQAPPAEPRDPEWMRWRADKVNEYSRQFVEEVRRARPGLLISLSPAPYPWCFENYLLEWPTWATWTPGNESMQWWDEFIPQCYRYDFAAFKGTWDQQVDNLRDAGAPGRVRDMLAGILTTGSKPEPVPWADLRRSVEHVRSTGGGGHVWWFSRGVLDEYPQEMASFYGVGERGRAANPRRPENWRPPPIPCEVDPASSSVWQDGRIYRPVREIARGAYRVIVRRGGVWREEDLITPSRFGADSDRPPASVAEGEPVEAVELLVDRRPEMADPITGG
jgi:uncharacterized lipoprotein YddW (UPF0748 family)